MLNGRGNIEGFAVLEFARESPVFKRWKQSDFFVRMIATEANILH